MAFTQKALSFSFSLANGNFQGSDPAAAASPSSIPASAVPDKPGVAFLNAPPPSPSQGGGNSMTISGLRASAKITKAGGADMSSLDAEIYGMTLSQMNQLTTFGTQYAAVGKNYITVQAGDVGGQLSTVFVGTITTAWMDATGMPDAVFRVSCVAGGVEAVMTPSPPTSVQGQGDVAQMMSNLAQLMNLQFENNNVNVKLANPYFPGSLRTQAHQIARAAGIEWIIDNGTLAIWPSGSARSGGGTLISKDTILIGYPGFTSNCVVVNTLFDPTLKFGANIVVQSDVTPACGTWNIIQMDYDLACQTPHGPWFVSITAQPMGSKPPAGD
jgi:hypothetical protein